MLNMENLWKQLDPVCVKDLMPDQVDDIFITRLLWGEEEDDDYITAYNMTWYFLQYPGLNMREKVYDKTWECIEKMMKKDLIICENVEDKVVDFTELTKHKNLIFKVMHNHQVGVEMYYYLFTITDKGWKFLHENLPKYQPIIDEICRLFHQDVADAKQKRATQN